MTTFNEVPRIERIALIARAMEYKPEFVKNIHTGRIDKTVIWCGVSMYDPYTNASQSQDVQERIGIPTNQLRNGAGWIAGHPDLIIVSAIAPTLREAIGDCAARWQWEKEREGK